MSQTDQLAKPQGPSLGRILFSWPVKLLGTLLCLWIISLQVNFQLMLHVLTSASLQWMLIGWFLTVAVLICAIAEWGVLIRSVKHVAWGRLVAVYIRMLGPAQLLPAGVAG